MRKVFYIIIFIIAIVLLGWLYELKTGDFRITNISYELPYHSELDVPTSPKQQQWLRQLLAQKFTWVGHGHQVFAFVSADHKYVLKIFKFKRLKPSFIDTIFSSIAPLQGYAEKRAKWREGRLKTLFRGYQIAYNYDRENAGLLYIHLNHTSDLQMDVEVQDRLGITHTVDIDKTAFAIQEYARKTKSILTDLLNRGQVAQASTHIRSLFDMYVAEYKQGILDQDRNILDNTGFVGERPIRLDIGKVIKDDSIKKTYRENLAKIAKNRLYDWLKKHYPQYHEEMARDMEAKLSSLFGQHFSFYPQIDTDGNHK